MRDTTAIAYSRLERQRPPAAELPEREALAAVVEAPPSIMAGVLALVAHQDEV
jgi:hypothetical protein